ncbi:MAG: arsenite methyltransferase [Actinobacteria bacterium]|nr:arsenite methyltransferase [Actinomycetota bacterium]
MKEFGPDEKRDAVRRNYAQVAERGASSCGCSPASSCCGPVESELDKLSALIGYSKDDLKDMPESSNMGLGCGNPHAIAALKPGEVVLDLGSGGGFDSFLAVRQVGEAGQVIGVDMTPEMVYKARENARKGGIQNVDFRLGEIENIPVADDAIDVILSNCVINLSPDKPQVFREAYRVLKPGGRISVSDVVALVPLPDKIKNDLALFSGCVSGAAMVTAIEQMLYDAGFENIRVKPKEESRELVNQWQPDGSLGEYILSATIEATKPASAKGSF